MKHYTDRATIEDALEVARNIRAEDKMEIEGLGHNLGALPFSVALSTVSTTFYAGGELAGVAGICPSGTQEWDRLDDMYPSSTTEAHNLCT